MLLRRITIDSTCFSVAVTPFAYAKVAPEPPFVRPFQAGQKGATASQVNRALYGRNKVKVEYQGNIPNGASRRLIGRYIGSYSDEISERTTNG